MSVSTAPYLNKFKYSNEMIPCTIVFISPLPTIVLDGKRYRKVGTICLRWFRAIYIKRFVVQKRCKGLCLQCSGQMDSVKGWACRCAGLGIGRCSSSLTWGSDLTPKCE